MPLGALRVVGGRSRKIVKKIILGKGEGWVSFFLRVISPGRVVIPFPQNDPMTYIVRENHIGSAVSSILWYK